MKIAIIALGTQGDVQPYIALGTGLLKAGHSVRLITHENFEQSVRAHKLEFYAMQGALPVYIGFGSMGSRNPKQTSKLVLEALKQTKCRAIMQAGWGGLSDENLPENVHTVDSVPHSWLFPRVAAVVHHGGAGTTAAGLRAGVPSIVIPFFGDQAFWGNRVTALGVGPRAIGRKQLTVENLAQAIEIAVTDSRMRQKARNLGAKIQAEDGIGNAVEAINEIMKN